VKKAATWIDAGPIAALADGQAKSIAVGRKLVAVVRSGEEYFAIEDVCTHDGAELTGGAMEGAEIICPRHGARFCLRTGQALTPPAYEPVRVFATKIDDGHLWVRAD
jgi:3-phenylpropionate/trans-cinnamate dioxygenase ferredoxin component